MLLLLVVLVLLLLLLVGALAKVRGSAPTTSSTPSLVYDHAVYIPNPALPILIVTLIVTLIITLIITLPLGYDHAVYIPMAGAHTSLNVAAALTCALYSYRQSWPGTGTELGLESESGPASVVGGRVRVRGMGRVRVSVPLRVARRLADARHPREARHGTHHVRVAKAVIVHRRQVARLVDGEG